MSTLAYHERFRLPAKQGVSTRNLRTLIYAGQFVLDMGAIYAAELISYAVRFDGNAQPDLRVLILAPIFGLMAFLLRCYSLDSMLSTRRSFGRMVSALALSVGLLLAFAFALKHGEELSRIAVFTSAGLALILLVAVRIPMLGLARALGSRFFARLLIVDGGASARLRGFDVIDARGLGLSPDLRDPHMLDYFSMLIGSYDRVMISCPPDRRENWAIYLKGSGCSGELHIPELHGIAYSGRAADDPVGIVVSVGPLDLRNRILKRALDLAVAIPAVLLLSPLFFLVAVAIKLDSPGPVFFRQRRMGRGNRLFYMRKFRSMRVELNDADGNRSASRDDERITRVGRVLRACSLDELPQLLNVIDGDMSLVGPRPHALGSLAGSRLFWQVDARYWLRHAIKPGITGLAQVRGFRGATDREEDLENRLQSDLEYVGEWSLMTDLMILARTLLVIVHKNAY
jgi:lipopolysaccharide/colanic/teichoic acid biosynthesis glycosyltransferase